MTENRYLKGIMACLLLFSMLILAKLYTDAEKSRATIKESDFLVSENVLSGNEVSQNRLPGTGGCIVIDPGHGGVDGGKIGVNGALEKDINLQMAFLLEERLTAEGFTVIMTRSEDCGLYDETSDNKKVQDLQNRIRLIEECNPIMVISIHQNSYSQESVSGAQVFYYSTSEEGKMLAECIQERMISDVDPSNHRQAKGNDSYYLLKKTPVPTVIVECGFLSNFEEAGLLVTDEYQEKMMDAVTEGILDYLEETESGAMP